MAESRHLLEDLQASTPDVRLGLSRAGVQGVGKAIRLRWGGAEKLISAVIDCTVDLDPAQKGVHMSRFPELFEEAIDEVVIGEAFLVEELAEHIAQHIAERQEALRAEVRIDARYPLERRTPVTGLATQETVSIIGIATASDAGVRRIVGVEATGINACPCAQGLVRGQAAERLLEGGFDEDDVERILELVPLATHNQRGRGTLYVGTNAPARSASCAPSWRRASAPRGTPSCASGSRRNAQPLGNSRRMGGAPARHRRRSAPAPPGPRRLHRGHQDQ